MSALVLLLDLHDKYCNELISVSCCSQMRGFVALDARRGWEAAINTGVHEISSVQGSVVGRLWLRVTTRNF